VCRFQYAIRFVLHNGIGFFVDGGKLFVRQLFQSLVFHYHCQITVFHFHQAVLWKIRIKYGYVVAQPIVHRTCNKRCKCAFANTAFLRRKGDK
jgi:hypothetical protein